MPIDFSEINNEKTLITKGISTTFLLSLEYHVQGGSGQVSCSRTLYWQLFNKLRHPVGQRKRRNYLVKLLFFIGITWFFEGSINLALNWRPFGLAARDKNLFFFPLLKSCWMTWWFAVQPFSSSGHRKLLRRMSMSHDMCMRESEENPLKKLWCHSRHS